jgi:hypothetical protein
MKMQKIFDRCQEPTDTQREESKQCNMFTLNLLISEEIL